MSKKNLSDDPESGQPSFVIRSRRRRLLRVQKVRRIVDCEQASAIQKVPRLIGN